MIVLIFRITGDNFVNQMLLYARLVEAYGRISDKFQLTNG
jgi:hypothetical protein